MIERVAYCDHAKISLVPSSESGTNRQNARAPFLSHLLYFILVISIPRERVCTQTCALVVSLSLSASDEVQTRSWGFHAQVHAGIGPEALHRLGAVDKMTDFSKVPRWRRHAHFLKGKTQSHKWGVQRGLLTAVAGGKLWPLSGPPPPPPPGRSLAERQVAAGRPTGTPTREALRLRLSRVHSHVD